MNARGDGILHDAQALRLAERLRPDRDPESTLAHVTWSVLVEPGDGSAGALIAELGAARALRFALDGETAPGADGAGLLAESTQLAEARARWMPRAAVHAVREAMQGCLDVGGAVLVPGDECWPIGLTDLGDHAPVMLWIRGGARVLAEQRTVAIVGARASTGYGDMVAAEIAGDLARDGVTIVSGGAYGIDAVAHRAALGVGGRTVAFLAGGIDRTYPAGHQVLFQHIRETGVIASEVPCGAAPTKWRFLQRNRCIAATGRATVVVEAGWRSGSLNTAGHASALGRPLGAIPGPVTSPASAGCHRLLREYDAVCVTTAGEVSELCGEITGGAASRATFDPEQLRLRDALSIRTPLEAHELAVRSGLSIERVRTHLGLMDAEGLARREEGGWLRTS